MNAIVLLLLPVALAASPDDYIVGGEAVDIADYPWQGSYRTAADTHTCGCVYVGSQFALTAGHCGGGTSYTVGLGNSDRTQLSISFLISVIRHPSYDLGPGFLPMDFAILWLATTPSGPNIAAGTIATTSTNPGGDGAITGWGITCGECDLPTALQGVASIPIISDSECAGSWGSDFNGALMICVYNDIHGSCNGDSGGPLSVGSTIYGLASWGIIGCDTTWPSVYAKVGAVSDWICTTTSNRAMGC